jgi:hypothetical protein
MDNVMQLAEIRTPHVRDLRANLVGELVVPGDENWDEARLAWHLAVDQRPAAVAIPENVHDVIEIVHWARESGLWVAPQGTGHNAPALGDLAGTVLLKTHKLRGVTIDPVAQTARAAAGTIWIEVVTADGELRRVDRDNDPDLFWAMRGGGGAFGVVTAIEFKLVPLTSVYAGHLFFPVERAAEVLRAWRDWTQTVPDEITSVGRILQLPPIDEIPEPFRGRSFVVAQAIYSGDDFDEAKRLIEPLRALGAEIDTFDVMPVPALSHLHMDPEQPTAGLAEGRMLELVTDETIDAFVGAVVGSPIVASEIRHLGGAVARPKPQHGALAAFEAEYLAFAVGMLPVPELRVPLEAAIEGFVEALEPWQAAHTYMNFVESRTDPRTLWTEAAHRRLKRIKAAYDPENVIRSNHPL